MSETQIRPLLPREIPWAMELVRRVFDRFEAPDYPREGVWEFYRYIRPRSIRRMVRRRRLRLWGAFRGEELAGVLALRVPAHLSLLFVDPAHFRQGIARALLNQAVAGVSAGTASVLTVNASPYGLEAYRRMGFAPTGPQCMTNGIIFIPMERALGLDPPAAKGDTR